MLDGEEGRQGVRAPEADEMGGTTDAGRFDRGDAAIAEVEQVEE